MVIFDEIYLSFLDHENEIAQFGEERDFRYLEKIC